MESAKATDVESRLVNCEARHRALVERLQRGTAQLEAAVALARASSSALEHQLAAHMRELAVATAELDDPNHGPQAGQQLRALNAELKRRLSERDADLESLSQSVSFELRSPLRAVNGYAQLVLEKHGDELSDDARYMVSAIHKAGERMTIMLDDVIRLLRLDRYTLRPGSIDTDRLVRDVIDDQQRHCEDRSVQWRIGQLPGCRGDAGLLRQVWTSLVANAIKYTRDRSPAVVEIDHGDGVFSIRDNGVGFDMRYADQLFRVFQRLHSSSDFEGHGIGLAIAARIVRRHGGRIWADSTQGSGTAFWFTLEAGALPQNQR